MQKIYVKINEKGTITHHFKWGEKIVLPSIISKKYSLIEIQKTEKVYEGFSTYINGVFSENKTLYDDNKQKTEYKFKCNQELEAIQKWLNENDWKVNKIVIGEWATTDDRWQEYLKERAEKRARRDEIILQLGGH